MILDAGLVGTTMRHFSLTVKLRHVLARGRIVTPSSLSPLVPSET
jgi:hypothetical protein